jgi:antitoxin Phd
MAEARVLLIDDELSILRDYGRALSGLGFDVTKAKNRSEALRRLENASFDVVVTDLLMPAMSGLELIQKVRTLAPQLPLIVMLSEMDNELAVAAAERGAMQSLVKPINGALLGRTVRNALRFRHQRRVGAPDPLNLGKDLAAPVTMNATDAKNKMGQMLDTVMQGHVVLITKNGSARAAVIPITEYERFSHAAETRLNVLSDEFDALLENMQTARARAGMRAAFEASPKQLANAAVEFARKRA